jgi:hypothetical protein
VQRAAAAALAVALAASASGCVTGAAIWKRDDRVSLPILLGAVAADFAVTTALAYQVQDFTLGASLGTAFAVTAVDFGVGCLFGACQSLRL